MCNLLGDAQRAIAGDFLNKCSLQEVVGSEPLLAFGHGGCLLNGALTFFIGEGERVVIRKLYRNAERLVRNFHGAWCFGHDARS